MSPKSLDPGKKSNFFKITVSCHQGYILQILCVWKSVTKGDNEMCGLDFPVLFKNSVTYLFQKLKELVLPTLPRLAKETLKFPIMSVLRCYNTL